MMGNPLNITDSLPKIGNATCWSSKFRNDANFQQRIGLEEVGEHMKSSIENRKNWMGCCGNRTVKIHTGREVFESEGCCCFR